MLVAQGIRYSKTSVKVVNEKKPRGDFNGAYWMLCGDCNETQAKVQKSEVRNQKSEVRSQ